MNRQEEQEYISLDQLRRLGWSNRLTWQLLGSPDAQETTEPFPKQPHRQLYRRERVQEAGRGKTFQVLRLTNMLYELRRVGIRLKEELRWTQALPVRLDPPGLTWDEIVDEALRRRENVWGRLMADREEPGSYGVLAGYSYLKHHCTNYDQLCALLRGRSFASFTYPVLLHRVNRMLLEIYPECLPRVKWARLDPAFRCQSCGRTAQGRHNGHYYESPGEWLQRLSHNGRSIRTFCSQSCSMPGNNPWRSRQGLLALRSGGRL